jgi:Tfp pilus assembly protein PilV
MRKNKDGFSFLELVFALGILSIGFVSLSNLSISEMRANKYSQDKTAALQLAQEKLESLKALSFSELEGGAESNLTVGNVGTHFQRETLVRKDASLAEITVKVSWSSRSNPTRFHVTELTTRIAG